MTFFREFIERLQPDGFNIRLREIQRLTAKSDNFNEAYNTVVPVSLRSLFPYPNMLRAYRLKRNSKPKESAQRQVDV